MTNLEGTFKLHPNSRIVDVSLSFKENKLSIQEGRTKSKFPKKHCRYVINLIDIVGSNCLVAADEEKDETERNHRSESATHLCVSCFIRDDKLRRKSRQFILQPVETGPKLDSCQRASYCLRWRNAILAASRGDQSLTFTESGLLSTCRIRVPNYLVVVNPFSGIKKGLEHFEKEILPCMRDAFINYQLLVTEYPGHARKFLSKIRRLSSFDAVLMVGGDGIVFECINGMMDWARDRKFQPSLKTVNNNQINQTVSLPCPIAVVPSGTGNALCSSLLSWCNESLTKGFVRSAVFLSVGPRTVPVDLMRVETSDRSIFYTVVGVAWGIIADVNRESEVYRYMGTQRYTVQAITRIMNLRHYYAEIAFLPDTEPKLDKMPSLDEANLPANWTVIEDYVVGIGVFTLPYISSDMPYFPTAQLNDGLIHIGIVRTNGLSRSRLMQIFNKLKTGQHESCAEFEHYRCQAFRVTPRPDKDREPNYPHFVILDGELAPSGPFQGYVLPAAATVLARSAQP